MANKLSNELSPYLLQHANNPVDWHPYGLEALEEAKRRNVPLIISIGYSACHWCHVMEHESFSDPDVADLMNSLFVCVKVDREERPDVDQIYMNAIQLLHGQGGWPLNCFALPDGRPFWGGTYFRNDQWKGILQQISDLYHDNHQEILTQAERIHQGIKSMGIIKAPDDSQSVNRELIHEAYQKLSQSFDIELGGMNGTPKFPMPSVWQFVLNYYKLTHDDKALEQLDLTLGKIASGGIFDQIGGGFARYSTDKEWKVPHFEKMLYDNAQLVSLYANAFHQTNNPVYSTVVTKTLHFIETELVSNEMGFFSALDADSEGEEGLFYTWTKKEIMELLPEYGELLSRFWGIDNQGYWEKGRNILVKPYTEEEFATREHLSAQELKQLLKMATGVLLAHRNKRVRPGLDDKTIISWNALMIKGYASASIVCANTQWKETAVNAANFLSQNMISDEGRILRTWKNGQARINGFLDDYAFTAEAFIALYQLTFDEVWLFKARHLTEYVLKEFSQNDSPLFWYLPENNEDTSITKLSRVLETTDGVEPSGNAVMAWVLLCLGNYFEEQSMIDRSIQMCTYMQENVKLYPGYYAYWANVSTALARDVNLVVIAGDNAFELARNIQRNYLPFTLLAASVNENDLPVFKYKFKEGKTLIYNCIGHKCNAPVENVEDISF